jgi:putative NADH-flavin reductase
MRLVVLGATGGTGLEIVRRAVDQGHSVTAFVRSVERLAPFLDRITVRQGDLLNSDELAQAIRDHEAVLSGFGPRLPISKTDEDILHRFALTLTSAMRQTGVRRVVVESTAFLFKDSVVPPTYLFGRLFFSRVVVDASAMEQVLRKSEADIDWTIVRPPKLTDNPYTGRYRVREGHLPRFGFNISRADVADCFIKAMENPATIGKVLGASN